MHDFGIVVEAINPRGKTADLYIARCTELRVTVEHVIRGTAVWHARQRCYKAVQRRLLKEQEPFRRKALVIALEDFAPYGDETEYLDLDDNQYCDEIADPESELDYSILESLGLAASRWPTEQA